MALSCADEFETEFLVAVLRCMRVDTEVVKCCGDCGAGDGDGDGGEVGLELGIWCDLPR